MGGLNGIPQQTNSRTPRRVRGLKCGKIEKDTRRYSRTPRRVRGLKFFNFWQIIVRIMSHPA